MTQSLIYNFTCFHLKVQIICFFRKCILLKATSPPPNGIKERQYHGFREVMVLIEHREETSLWNKSCFVPSSRAACYHVPWVGLCLSWREHTHAPALHFPVSTRHWPQLIVPMFMPDSNPFSGQSVAWGRRHAAVMNDTWPSQPEPSFRESKYETQRKKWVVLRAAKREELSHLLVSP